MKILDVQIFLKYYLFESWGGDLVLKQIMPKLSFRLALCEFRWKKRQLWRPKAMILVFVIYSALSTNNWICLESFLLNTLKVLRTVIVIVHSLFWLKLDGSSIWRHVWKGGEKLNWNEFENLNRNEFQFQKTLTEINFSSPKT